MALVHIYRDGLSTYARIVGEPPGEIISEWGMVCRVRFEPATKQDILGLDLNEACEMYEDGAKLSERARQELFLAQITVRGNKNPYTLRDLSALSEAEVLEAKGIGPRRVRLLKGLLRYFRLNFREG